MLLHCKTKVLKKMGGGEVVGYVCREVASVEDRRWPPQAKQKNNPKFDYFVDEHL